MRRFVIIAAAIMVVGAAMGGLTVDRGWSAATFEEEVEEFAFELELTGIFDEGMRVYNADCPTLSSTRPGATLTCRIDYAFLGSSSIESVDADFEITGRESFMLTGLHLRS